MDEFDYIPEVFATSTTVENGVVYSMYFVDKGKGTEEVTLAEYTKWFKLATTKNK